MKISDAICKKRTIRLFKQDKIGYNLLEKCVDSARLSSSARNTQLLEYIIIDDETVLKKIIPLLNFGGFITEDKKARKGSEPTALIVIIVKKDGGNYYQYDVGIAAQNICLVAYENSVGSCMMGAFDKGKVAEELNIPDDYFVDLIIALGYPDEKPVAEEADSNTDYYRKDNRLHVPKKKLNEVLHRNSFF